MNKRVLLIAGGGTLGSNTASELLQSGERVDIICLEDNTSSNENLRFFKNFATYEYLKEFLQGEYYDAIVNFVHYTDTEEYKRVHMLLCAHTDQLVFLSSERVYADEKHPITEDAPQLYDVLKDEDFLQNEDYAVPKSKNERFIKNESGTKNWTIVRPVISFSERRLDLVTVSGRDILDKTSKGEKILLPEASKNLVAGLDWAKNSGKLIAKLLFKEEALGEDFTVSSAQNLTWGTVAGYYEEIIGASFCYVGNEEYSLDRHNTSELPFIFKYDRLYSREIDNSKILKVTGLTKNDFFPIKEGIKTEINKLIEKGAFKL